jgi:Domain of unknown function (DUF4267)
LLVLDDFEALALTRQDNLEAAVLELHGRGAQRLILTFTLLRDRRAMGLSLLFGAIIPVGDAIVVLRHSPSPPEYLPLHLIGAVVCLVLAAILLRVGR